MSPFERQAMWSDGDTFVDHLGVEGAPRIARQHLCYFGKGGGGGTQTSTSTQQMQLPQWVENAGHDNYTYAQTVADQLKPTSIPGVADLTPGQQQIFSSLMGNVGAANPWFNQAAGAAG